MSKNIKPKVFLAHNSQDKPQIRVIASKLSQKGIDPWLDENEIPPGVFFQDHIQKVIQTIDSAIIFIGNHGLGQWQVLELRAFITRLVNSQIPVIPVLLPGVEKIPDDLIFLKELNWVQFASNLEDPNIINRLVWGVTRNPKYIDYSELTGYLSAGIWKKANTETKRIILQSANQEEDGFLDEAQMRDFDCDVLLTLDKLWLQYSNSRFGFSIQKKILNECQLNANRFGTRVGWKLSDKWINLASVNYNLDAPIGHLPYGMLDIVELNNAILDGFVNAQFKITKALAKQDWQKQIIADSVGILEFITGNKNYSSKDFKEGLDYQLSRDEGWWQGERAEHKKIENLSLLLCSCSELTAD